MVAMKRNAPAPLAAPGLSILGAGPVTYQLNRQWREILHLGVKREFSQGTTMKMPGDPVNHLYLLTKGAVLISNYLPAAKSVPLTSVRANSILGIIPFFHDRVCQSFWQVQADCTVYLFSRETIYNDVPRHLLLNLLEYLANMGRHMTTRACGQSGASWKRLLAILLLHLGNNCPAVRGEPTPNSRHVNPGLTQETFSQMLGVHRVQLNRALGVLRREGAIGKFTKRLLELDDLALLRDYAEGRKVMENATGKSFK